MTAGSYRRGGAVLWFAAAGSWQNKLHCGDASGIICSKVERMNKKRNSRGICDSDCVCL